eukprot:2295578-Alexandrium_andersonii.AAC.1
MHPSGASGANFEAFLGPHNSRFERLRRCCMFGKVDRGLRRIAVVSGPAQLMLRTPQATCCLAGRFRP